MIKKLLFIAICIGLFVSCNNQNEEKATAVTTSEFATLAENMVDQRVSIEGTVLHVCKHGGKKMFISDDRVKIIASESIAAFDTELEGSTVVVEGIVREEAIPVLAEETGEPKHSEGDAENNEATQEEAVKEASTDAAQIEEADAKPAEACDMEKVKPLYVIEVVKVTEKVQ